MEQFVFQDIFDTKGIEYIIVISFFLVLIPFWYLLSRPLKADRADQGLVRALNLDRIRIPGGIFFSRNHTWTHLERGGLAAVGMDDLLLQLTGGVELSYLKKQHDRVKKGEPLVVLKQGGKELLLSAPLGGVVDRVHDALEKQDGEQDPYLSWLYMIKPSDWKADTKDSLLDEEAVQWAESELGRVKEFLGRQAAAEHGVMQTGGELAAFPLKEMNKQVWSAFEQQFL